MGLYHVAQILRGNDFIHRTVFCFEKKRLSQLRSPLSLRNSFLPSGALNARSPFSYVPASRHSGSLPQYKGGTRFTLLARLYQLSISSLGKGGRRETNTLEDSGKEMLALLVIFRCLNALLSYLFFPPFKLKLQQLLVFFVFITFYS